MQSCGAFWLMSAIYLHLHLLICEDLLLTFYLLWLFLSPLFVFLTVSVCFLKLVVFYDDLLSFPFFFFVWCLCFKFLFCGYHGFCIRCFIDIRIFFFFSDSNWFSFAYAVSIVSFLPFYIFVFTNYPFLCSQFITRL